MENNDLDLSAISTEMDRLYAHHRLESTESNDETAGVLVKEEDRIADAVTPRSRPYSTAKDESNVRVVIRVRPPLEHELSGYLGIPYRPTTKVAGNRRNITLLDGSNADMLQQSFTFDHVYDTNTTQREVYDTTAKPLVSSCLEGYNATILAYGQTGTGKTHTMEGISEQFEERGIVPRAIEQIFSHIQEKATSQNRFLVRASYLQIYNDVIYDLLKPETLSLQIREDDKTRENNRGVYVEGLSEWVVRSPQEIFKLMARGASRRATGKTKLNDVSSRSHAILKLIIEQCETSFVDLQGRPISATQFEALLSSNLLDDKSPEQLVRQRFRVAKLNLVDLAGSERVRVSGATGQRLEESRKINRSLSALGNVISALTDFRGRNHIPYRDSKLTRILEDSLGGNCRTAMIAMVSPALDAAQETLSTLKFANRAKNIRNNAFVNEDVDKNSLLRKYERELKRLRKELQAKKQNVVDHRVVLELEDQKRRAEADKMAALRALESRSMEFMQEKQEKRKLEEKISELESQMLGEERQVLDAQRDQIREEYQEKMDDLEKEREQIEAQRAQVGRYKQLLLKQRDIMVALTQRLNERDDQIVALQDELDECEKRLHQTQERLDKKTAEMIHLQRLVMELQQRQPQQQQQQQEQDMSATKDTNPAQVGLEARVRALTFQYQTFRDEMTDRLGKKEAQLSSLREENSKLGLQLKEQEQKQVQRQREESVNENNVEMLAEMDKLRLRSVNHAKEQLAMRTIMEKINVLVLDVMSSQEEMSPEATHKVKVLASLVRASVDALSPPE